MKADRYAWNPISMIEAMKASFLYETGGDLGFYF